ncbi:MAG: competence/damage-inducible protein CinA-like protein [Actinomycetia bacterium]|nr:competence/damage-inducible protein CinA-like protein [Actinomycetes bacterium]
MRCDVLAIGTELLLGQIVDTNSSWIGEQLATAGIDTFEHRKVGDNLPRMVSTLREMLDRADAVIVCGGLGPTPDDVTREAIAEVMGVPLERREDLIEWIGNLFGGRGREMPANNLRQADVPVGGDIIPNPIGTAPGLLCSVGDKVVYAVPGVPYEMQLMVEQTVLPDLLARSGEKSAIVSRSLKTWGTSESGLAEMIADRVEAQTNPSIAFLARGIEGIVVRITAKARTREEAEALIVPEEAALREVLGDLVFGVDDETMEFVVLRTLEERGWTLGVAESLTGGMIGGRIANVAGASRTFRGTVGCYATDVKRTLLGVTAEHVVSEEAAKQMAVGVQRVLGSDVGISVTGVAGPDEQDDQPVGTVWFGFALPGHEPEAVSNRLPGDRERVRQFSTISLMNMLRQRLAALPD